MNTLKIVGMVEESNQTALCAYLEKTYPPILKPDVSNYAKGRQRIWLEKEATLVKDWKLLPGHKDVKLWSWIVRELSQFGWEPQLGLIAQGPVGIDLHRDATYADWMGYNINLGEDITWLYRECWSDYRWSQDCNTDAPITKIQVPKGAIIRFCVKNPHGVGSPITDKRWSLNLWRLKG